MPDMLVILAEIAAAIAGFWIAAELIATGTERMEPVVGQGMAGGVVLGLMGALPETIFVVVATLAGSYDIAIGSAIGGNIILFTLGLGLIGIIYAVKWKSPMRMKGDYMADLWFLLGSTAALVLLMLYGSLDKLSGFLLLAIYAAYLIYRYTQAHRMMSKNVDTPGGRRLLLGALCYIGIGIAIVTPLSYFFVGLISSLSMNIGIPALWVALVLSPLAADLDENISAYRIISRSRGGGSTAVVSFIGSKIQNNTMLLGLIGLLAAGSVGILGVRIELSAVVVVNLIATVLIMRGRLTSRDSVLLIAAYAATVAGTLLL